MFNLIQTTPSCSVFLSVSRLVTRRNEIFSVFSKTNARKMAPQTANAASRPIITSGKILVYNLLYRLIQYSTLPTNRYRFLRPEQSSRFSLRFVRGRTAAVQPIFKLAIWSWPWSKVDPGLYFILEFQRWGVMEKWKFKCLSISTAMIGAISRTAWRRIAEYTVSFDKSFRAEILKIHSNSNTAFREGSESAAFENSSFRRKLCDISRKHKRRRMEFSRVQMSDIKFQRVSVSLWNDELLATIWQCTDLRNVARTYYSKLFNYVW